MSALPTLEIIQGSNKIVLKIAGSWQAKNLRQIDEMTQGHTLPLDKEVTVDCKSLQDLDTAGAWLLNSIFKKFSKVHMINTVPKFQALLEQVRNYRITPLKSSKKNSRLVSVTDMLAHLGENTVSLTKTITIALSFFGEVCSLSGPYFLRPWRFRTVSLSHFMYVDGVRAIPIVGLISFMIGIVLVYQGSDQLKRFGAEIFTVDLLAISALREIGILLTAIVVAGRSGSAFTAQIGYMKLNQEIDAMIVLGLNPIDLLVLPRILALVIVLPLLAFLADMMALSGGALMTSIMLDLNFDDFLHHLRLAIKPWTFWTGIIKAPVFAFFIGLIGCFEGLKVQGGAQSVGTHTTKAVVQSIFLVVVLDALFSIIFSILRI